MHSGMITALLCATLAFGSLVATGAQATTYTGCAFVEGPYPARHHPDRDLAPFVEIGDITESGEDVFDFSACTGGFTLIGGVSEENGDLARFEFGDSRFEIRATLTPLPGVEMLPGTLSLGAFVADVAGDESFLFGPFSDAADFFLVGDAENEGGPNNAAFYTLIGDALPVLPPIPLPAGGVLLLGALGALGAVRVRDRLSG